MAQVLPARFMAFDGSGDPLSGGKLHTYIAGTSTDKATYSDPGLTTPNANPVVLDSRGEAAVFGSGTYKLVLKTSADVTIWTQDDIEVAGASQLVDADGDTKIQVEESADEDIIRFDIGGTEQLTIQDGKFEPTTDNDIDLGAATKEFKDLFIDGTANIDTLAIDAFSDTQPVADILPGLFRRPIFTWKDADEIYIDPGLIHHQGTVEQFVYWDSQLTYQFGSGGSNPSSDNLAANKWFYLFIDDSAVVTLGTNLLTAAELIAKNEDNVTIAWNAAKHGWYETTTTSDRCIGGFLTDGSSNILEFFHDGGEEVIFADQITDLSATDIDNAWTDVTLTIPSFATRAKCAFHIDSVESAAFVSYWRTNGQAGTTGHLVGLPGAVGTNEQVNTDIVFTDSSQVIEVYHSVDTTATMAVYTQSWFFPEGM